LRRALGDKATAPDWALLAARFHSSDPERSDLRAALAIARESTRRFRSSPIAYLTAAETAQQLGEVQLAIRWFERGLTLDPRQADASSQLAELYLSRIAQLAQTDRPRAAGEVLRRFEQFHRKARASLEAPVEPDRADALATMGRGLVSLGELAAARQHLERSMAERDTLEALESLGTIALKRDRPRRAIELFERALAKRVDEPRDRFHQCRLLRLLAEAHLAAGERRQAASRFRAALVAWHRLSQEIRLPSDFLAEALVEQGKVLWRLDERDTALRAFDAAVDSDPEGRASYADVVAFLIVRDQYDRAVDAYHRALHSRTIEDPLKVYMSLWVLAEARRQGREPDLVAREFLAGRQGRLWHDDLARFAAGQVALTTLESRATTRGRRAELLYYSAVLAGDLRQNPRRARRLLEGVVASDMVLFFEYDMAKHWLENGFGAK
jgi:tetratricopeptide (TPR) repeat protein